MKKDQWTKIGMLIAIGASSACGGQPEVNPARAAHDQINDPTRSSLVIENSGIEPQNTNGEIPVRATRGLTELNEGLVLTDPVLSEGQINNGLSSNLTDNSRVENNDSTDESYDSQDINIVIPKIFELAQPIEDEIEGWFAATNLDPQHYTFILAQMMQESNADPLEDNGGIMQIASSNVVAWCRVNPEKCAPYKIDEQVNYEDPDLLAIAGIEYSKERLELYADLPGNEQYIATAAAYNGGGSAVPFALEYFRGSPNTAEERLNYVDFLVSQGWDREDDRDENGNLISMGAETKSNVVIAYVDSVVFFYKEIADRQLEELNEIVTDPSYPLQD